MTRPTPRDPRPPRPRRLTAASAPAAACRTGRRRPSTTPATGPARSSSRWRRSASTSSSASPAARSCRRTTRSSTRHGAAHPGPPRAGRRPRRHRVRPGHRQGRRLHRHLRPGRDQPGHADRRRVHGLGADRGDHRPGGPAARSARTPSRRPTSRASRCRSPSTTSWCRPPRRSRGSSPRRSTSPAPAGPGPVLVDIPKDVLQAQTTFSWPPTLDLPGYRPTLHPHGKQIREAARLIADARRPVLYVGGGVLKAGATDGLRKLAELTGIPVVTTLMAPRRVPRLAPAAPGHARHARHGRRGLRAAEGGPDRGAGRPVRRPGHRQAGLVRARTRRSCTPTSTRPRSARTAPRTCRSSATPGTSSTS